MGCLHVLHSVYLCFESFLKWIPMTTGLRKTINIIMFNSIKESAENWLQPRGSGQEPTPHQLPPTHCLLPLGFSSLESHSQPLWWRLAKDRELVMLLGSWGRRSEIPSMSPDHPQHTHTHTHTHTRMPPTQLPVFAGLTDEVTRSWIRVTELAATSPPDTALFLGNTFQVPKHWLISSFWQLTHK